MLYSRDPRRNLIVRIRMQRLTRPSAWYTQIRLARTVAGIRSPIRVDTTLRNRCHITMFAFRGAHLAVLEIFVAARWVDVFDCGVDGLVVIGVDGGDAGH